MTDDSMANLENATESSPSATAVATSPSTSAVAAVTTSNTSATAASAAAPSSSSSSPANIEFEPPAACIRRLLKQALPKSTNVSRDSLAAISRASGIFVLYLTACANDVAREGRRSTIVAKDVLGALKELEFGDFVPLLERFLEVHRREERSKKEGKERAKRATQAQAGRPEGAQERKEGIAPGEDLGRDATTGKFVAKDKQRDGGATETEAVVAVEPVTAVEMKHAKEEEEGDHVKAGVTPDEPSSKKQKVDDGVTPDEPSPKKQKVGEVNME